MSWFKRYWFEMKNLFAAILFMFTASGAFATPAALQYIKDIKHIEVILKDHAKDACWTSLRTAREYAEEKIRMADGTIYQDGASKVHEQYYALVLTVSGYRTSVGKCVGYVGVQLETGAQINGIFHHAVVRGANQSFSGYNNANDLMIEFVQSFFGGS